MTGFELVAGVIGIFFIAGIAMGVLIVAVLPRWRGSRSRKGDFRELPPRNDDERRQPRWPDKPA